MTLTRLDLYLEPLLQPTSRLAASRHSLLSHSRRQSSPDRDQGPYRNVHNIWYL